MAIIEALGINSSVFIQAGIFIFTIFFLAQFVFAHYAKALEARDKNTIGSQGLAEELSKSTEALHNQYETRAREVSGQIKTIFDSYRTEANKEYESIVTRAREESMKIIESTRAQVGLELDRAAAQIKEEAPKVSVAITQKLLAKDRATS